MSKRGRNVYRDRRWKAARREALKRDDYQCQAVELDNGEKCGRRGILEVDHIVPISKGGNPFNLDNLQTLCRRCHFQKTALENSTDHNLTRARQEWDNHMNTTFGATP